MNCCAMTDVVATRKFDLLKLKPADTTDSEESTNDELMDKPYITFKIKNINKNDSIYAWYRDYSCNPSFKLIDKNGWEYGVPQKCYYWNNISPFIFFKTNAHFSKNTNEYGIITDVFPDDKGTYEPLATIYVRIFDDNKYVITYNGKTRKIIITLDQD